MFKKKMRFFGSHAIKLVESHWYFDLSLLDLTL
jgi:hypothetical protein